MANDPPKESEEPELLHTQALLVTAGPFKGRICLNDDDDYIQAEDLESEDLAWIALENVNWRTIHFIDEDIKEGLELFDIIDCEVVTFGFYMHSHRYHLIPRQFLIPATMKDLIQRYQEIDEVCTKAALGSSKRPPMKTLYDYLLEQIMINNEITKRDNALRDTSVERKVFLCHSSEDKPYVRRIAADLKSAGHAVWIDEFEIKVGDSIVQKINDATTEADSLILFISKAALKSDWVKREWSSALARSLSGASIRVLPVLIEECDPPTIMADIKFADFRKSYAFGLRELTSALAA